jgi:hypothetical protein
VSNRKEAEVAVHATSTIMLCCFFWCDCCYCCRHCHLLVRVDQPHGDAGVPRLGGR